MGFGVEAQLTSMTMTATADTKLVLGMRYFLTTGPDPAMTGTGRGQGLKAMVQ
jgi:hypothetical protein